MDRPNVLWIMTDQHNFRALSCAGHATVKTPNIDRLAEDGVRFERAYSPAPTCGPARAALFTGRYPREIGVHGNNECFDAGVHVLPALLREAGYHTGLVGKLHLSPKAAPHGFEHRETHDAMYDCYDAEEPWNSDYVTWLADRRFDGDVEAVVERANDDERAFVDRHSLYRFLMGSNWRTEDEHSNTWVTERSVEYLREHREDPFFLYTSYFGPHQPMLAPEKWAELYTPDTVELPPEFALDPDEKPIASAKANTSPVFRYFRDHDWPEHRYREVLAAYFGQISMIDAGVGRILDELDRQGVRDETVVVFTSDHGDHAGQFGWFFKGSMYEGSVRIPLVVSDPAFDETAGETTDHVVSNLDVFATVLDRCGVEDHESPRSRSLCSLIDDPHRDDWLDETYSELHEQSMLVRDHHKLVRTTRPNGDTVYELYDNAESPYDETDLWDSPRVRDRQERMVRTMAARRDETSTSAMR